MVVAYLGYATCVVPLIEGPPRARVAKVPVDDFDPMRFKADLVAWLPEDAWERGSCKQLSTRSGHIFYQEYRPYDNGRVELKPLTIILPQSDSADSPQPPIILRAPEGAILKLDRPLSLGGKAVQLESGQLLGPVTIYHAATDANAGDEWVIQTSQVQLSKQKIQTIEDVDFRFGPHFGHGRNLVIELETDPLRAQQRAMTGIRGARRIELVQVHRLHLVPEGNSVSESIANDQEEKEKERIRGLTLPARQEDGQEVATDGGYPNGFDVTCSGPFEFDLQLGLATLRSDVKIVACDEPEDWLAADAIELQLSPGETTSNATPNDTNAAHQPWALQSIVAIGQPAILNSTTRQLLVRGERLKYDMQRQMIDVAGSRGVELRQADIELTAADAQYQITSDGSLGTALLHGPGVLRRGAAANQPPFEIHWREKLSIVAEAGQKAVSLIGAAQIIFDGQSQIVADQLRVWMWELRDVNETTAAAKWTLHPDRLLAAGHVQIDSTRMSGAVDELRAQWPQPPPSNPTPAIKPPRGAIAAAAPQQPQPITPPTPVGLEAATGPQPKVSFRGKVASVQMLNGSAVQFREVAIDGDVLVEQTTPDGIRALEIAGQQLRITPQENKRFRLAVTGGPEQPSRVQAQQLTLVGQTVQLDQSANRLWIDGPGSMHAEQTAPLNPQDTAAPAEAAAGPTSVDVRWAGGMVFDGQQIYFETDVLTTCEQAAATGINRIEARSAAINLSIQPSVDLSGAQSAAPAERPQIEKLTLMGEVSTSKLVFAVTSPSKSPASVELVRQSFDINGQVASIQQMSVPWGQVNATSGQLNMTGPGSVSMWQMTAPSAIASPLAAAQPPAAQLTNTQIRFEESITGNIRQTELTFNGKVRTIHGPVADWKTSLDADRTQPTGDLFRLRSDQLQITQWQRDAAETAHVEIIALGQARLEGETFEALAERIGYNQSQEKVILEGDPRNGAQLTYQTTPGGPRNPLVASKIAYNLRDHTTQVDGFKHGVLTTGPILPRR